MKTIKTYLIIWIILMMYFSSTLPAQAIPVWLEQEKAFTNLPDDEQFYFLKCQVQDNGIVHKIGFVVYSFSKQASRWRIWKYDANEKNFLVLDEKTDPQTVRNYLGVVPPLVIQKKYRNKRLITKKLITSDDLFWITIHFIDQKQYQRINHNNLILVSGQSLKNESQRLYIDRHDLMDIQLAVFNTHNVIKRPDQMPVKRLFDASGYMIFQYFAPVTETQTTEIQTTETQTTETREQTSQIDHMDELPFSMKEYVFINNTYHHYFRNYGYVNLNAFFQSSDIASIPDNQLFITNLSRESILYSPVLTKGQSHYFYYPVNWPSACLWQKRDSFFYPLGCLTTESQADQNSRFYFIYKPFQWQKNSDVEKWLERIDHFNTISPIEQKRLLDQICSVNSTCRQSIKNLSYVFKQGYVKGHTEYRYPLSIPSTQWQIITNAAQDMIIQHQTHTRHTVHPPQRFHIENEVLQLNSSGLKETFFKVPVYPSNSWYYYTADMKKWMIFDNYVSRDQHAVMLRKFKQSNRLQKEILKHNPFARIDLIQGLKVKQVQLDSKFYDSYYSDVCEIESLLNLQKHPAHLTDISWEIHLFVAQNISGFHNKSIDALIAHHLKQLKVKRIHLWEFCDHKVSDTLYNQLFTHIAHTGFFDYYHHIIWSNNQFQDVMK